MNTFKTRAAVLLIVCLSVGSYTSHCDAQQAHDDEPSAAEGTQLTEEMTEQTADHLTTDEAKASFWMDQKLRLSKEMLAGLASGDFDVIGKKAEFMRGLNRVEQFVRRGPAGYRSQLKSFNAANEAIVQAAQDEDLDAATKGFNRLTTSCVSCHQHLRGEK
jgi:cytochrome c556